VCGGIKRQPGSATWFTKKGEQKTASLMKLKTSPIWGCQIFEYLGQFWNHLINGGYGKRNTSYWPETLAKIEAGHNF
jgi:hypothetical protein